MDLSVLMVTPFFQPMVNGISVYVSHLVRGLVDQGVRVHVQTMRYDKHDGILSSDDRDFSVSRFKSSSFFGGEALNQPISLSFLKSTIDESDDFDVVHVHDCPKLLNDAVILALKRLKPAKVIVLTPHGAGLFSPVYMVSSKTTGQQFEVPFHKGPLYSLQKVFSTVYWSSGVPLKVVRSADHLVTVTPLQKEVFAKVCDEQKISMISEAVPPNYFVDKPSFLEDGKLKVLFIGRIIQEKGIKDLLYAVSSVSKMSNKQVELRCVGPDYGFMQEALKIIGELGLENMVSMLGSLPEDQKLQNLSWCDVLVLPSYHEAFGIPIVEAMAHGKPVIATKTVGAVSLVKNNETGFLVNFGDPNGIANSLIQFMNNPTLKYDMGNKALASALPFSMQNMTKSHIDLYRNLVSGKPEQ